MEIGLGGVQDKRYVMHMTRRHIVIYIYRDSSSPYLVRAAAVRWLSKDV